MGMWIAASHFMAEVAWATRKVYGPVYVCERRRDIKGEKLGVYKQYTSYLVFSVVGSLLLTVKLYEEGSQTPDQSDINTKIGPGFSYLLPFGFRGPLIEPAACPGSQYPMQEQPDPPDRLHGESHNLNFMLHCANTAKQMAGAPASTSCLCWPRDGRHPSEVTPAVFHKVNLALKMWYLLTRLMETDGSMTFIEFFTSRFWSWRSLFRPLCTLDVFQSDKLLQPEQEFRSQQDPHRHTDR